MGTRKPVSKVLKMLADAGMLIRNEQTIGMDLGELTDYVIERTDCESCSWARSVGRSACNAEGGCGRRFDVAVFRLMPQGSPPAPVHGYGFSFPAPDGLPVTYVFDNIEGAELAAVMAQGMGDESFGWPIFIYPYFDGKRARGGARVVVESNGSAQCAY